MLQEKQNIAPDTTSLTHSTLMAQAQFLFSWEFFQISLKTEKRQTHFFANAAFEQAAGWLMMNNEKPH